MCPIWQIVAGVRYGMLLQVRGMADPHRFSVWQALAAIRYGRLLQLCSIAGCYRGVWHDSAS